MIDNYNPFQHHLDWVTLSQSVESFNMGEKAKRVYEIAGLLKDIFKFPTSINLDEGKTVKLTSECYTVQIRVDSQKAQFQFRGLFFLYHPFTCMDIIEEVYRRLYLKNHFSPVIQKKINEILQSKEPEEKKFKLLRQSFEGNEETQPRWVVTRTDIRKDFLNIDIFKVFPIGKDKKGLINGDKGLFWTFVYEMKIYTDKEKETTGFNYNFNNGSWTIYDKGKENKQNKIKGKEGKFNELYDLKGDETISRVELRLDGKERNVDFTKYLRDLTLKIRFKETEKDIMQRILNRYTQRNKILIINPSDNTKSRWEIEERFLKFINIEGEYKRTKTQKIEYKFKGDEKVKRRALSTLANQITLKKKHHSEEIALTKEDEELFLMQLRELVSQRNQEEKTKSSGLKLTEDFSNGSSNAEMQKNLE